MPRSNTPNFVFHSPPFFSANWIGRHPHDNRPSLLVCFGPSLPDDFAALQAGVLGLESILEKAPPPVTSVRARLDGGAWSCARRTMNVRPTAGSAGRRR